MSDSEKRDWESYKKLAEFDFKCLEELKRKKKILRKIYWKYYTAAKLLKQFIDALNRNEVKEYNYQKWFEWKFEIKEGETGIQIIKQKQGAHLDDSDESNPWIRAVYYILWGKRIDTGLELDKEGNKVDKNGTGIGVYEYGWGNFRTSYLGLFKDGEKMLWGSDTMNTIAFYRDAIENYKNKNDENEEKVDELCRKCHCLGNFVLVPAYFNQRRGGCDQIELALYKLCQGKITDDFSFRDSQCGSVTKVDKLGEKFNTWNKDGFTQYINMFFLWDYVEPARETGYSVKNMKTGEIINEKNKKTVKIDERNISQYIINANRYIERRGIFMAAMLKIAVEFRNAEIGMLDYKEDGDAWKVSDIYKYIVEKVFLTGETYSDYDKVFGAIEEAIKGITKEDGETQNAILGILENAKKEIDKVGRCK